MPDASSVPDSSAADESVPAAANPLDELVRVGVATLRAKLDGPLHPHVFDELSTAASALYKACMALEPVVTLPHRRRPATMGGEPLAPAPAVEGAGAKMARELVGAVQELAAGGRAQRPQTSRKDLMAAIALAEKAGLEKDAERLRAELFGEEDEIADDLLPPKLKVDRANELIAESNALTERAKSLLQSVKPNEIVDAKSWDARLQIGCVIRVNGNTCVIRTEDHLKAAIESGAEFVCERPHVDGDWSYNCGDPDCACNDTVGNLGVGDEAR